MHRLLVFFSYSLVVVFILLSFQSYHWSLDLLSHARVQWLVLTSVMAIVSYGILKRRYLALACCIAACGHSLAIQSHVSAVARLPLKCEGTSIRVLTCNLYAKNQQVLALQKFVAEVQPDIMGCQEVNVFWQANLGVLRPLLPFHSFIDASHREMMFMSKLPHAPLKKVAIDRGVFLPALTTYYNLDGQTIAILAWHSEHVSRYPKLFKAHRDYFRIPQWVKEQKRLGHEVIVMGDFNCSPWSTLYGNFVKQSGLIPAQRGSICTATWRVGTPVQMMIDHIFYSSGLTLTHFQVGPDIGSDHRPIYADFQLKHTRTQVMEK